MPEARYKILQAYLDFAMILQGFCKGYGTAENREATPLSEVAANIYRCIKSDLIAHFNTLFNTPPVS
jgi:hypothetical protein